MLSLPSPYGVHCAECQEQCISFCGLTLPSPYGVYCGAGDALKSQLSDYSSVPLRGILAKISKKQPRNSLPARHFLHVYFYYIITLTQKESPRAIRITFLVRIQPLSLAHSMVKLRLRTKTLSLLPYFKRKASS